MGRRLKICQLVYDHPRNPWCGGGGARRVWAINALLAQRHDITVYCGAFPGAAHQGEPYPVHFTGGGRRYVESRLRFVADVHRIDPRGFDLFVEEFSYYAPLMPITGGRPLITVLQGQHGLKALRWRGVYGLASVLSEYLLLPTRRAVILVSAHLKSSVHPAARTVVIGQGVDLPDALPPWGEAYVLFIGRMDIRHKGIDTLMAAWSRLTDEQRTLPLVVAGGGDTDAVRRMAARMGARDVRFTGRLSHDAALAAIRRAAFLVMPSRMEGSPLVLYEALALGKPVIGTSIPPIAALLPHETAGLLVPPDDPAALASAIGTLLRDAGRRARMAQAAARIGEGLTWERQAQKQEQFYRDVMTNGKRRDGGGTLL